MYSLVTRLGLIGLFLVAGCDGRFQRALEVATDPRDPMQIYPSYQAGVLLERYPGEVMEQRGPYEVIVPRRHADSFGGYSYSPPAPPQLYYPPPVVVLPDRRAENRNHHHHQKVVCVKKGRDGRSERMEMSLHEWAEWSRTQRERERRFGRERGAPEWRCEVEERRW